MKRLSLLAALALLLALCLLATAAPALAGGAAISLHGTFLDFLDYGVEYPDTPQVGDVTTLEWTFYGRWLKATGPEGGRLLGYIVQTEDMIVRPSGNNSHVGVIAYTTADPSLTWNADDSWQENLDALPEGSLLWVGTATGATHADHNHVFVNYLEGRNGNTNLTATVRWVANNWTNTNASAVIDW
jgi:hypothetical protein